MIPVMVFSVQMTFPSGLTWQDQHDRLARALVVVSAGPVQPHLASVREGEDLPPVLDVADQEVPHEGGHQGLEARLPAPECGEIFLPEDRQRLQNSVCC